MNLGPVEHFFEHICHHFLVGLLFHLLHPPKSDDKYAQKLVRGSSFRSDFLQNRYFSNKLLQSTYECDWRFAMSGLEEYKNSQKNMYITALKE